jgi:hypothetical protein
MPATVARPSRPCLRTSGSQSGTGVPPVTSPHAPKWKRRPAAYLTTRPRPVGTTGDQPGLPRATRGTPGSQHHTTGPRRGPPSLSPPPGVRLPHPRPTPHPPHPHICLTHSWSGVRIPLRAPSHNHLSLNWLCSRKPARNARIFTLTTARGDKLVTNHVPKIATKAFLARKSTLSPG